MLVNISFCELLLPINVSLLCAFIIHQHLFVVHSWCLLTFPCCHLCASLFINASSLGSFLTPWCFSSPLCCVLLLFVNALLVFFGHFLDFYFPFTFFFLGVGKKKFNLFFNSNIFVVFFQFFFFFKIFFLIFCCHILFSSFFSI